jgi:diadenosine tetraphosphate (Ap4A) HIT family hydrolase
MEHLSSTHGCPFCGPLTDRSLLLETDMAFAIFDKYPVNAGHALIIPKRHCANYFDLTTEEQATCWQLLNEVKAMVAAQFKPDGFNIGINIGDSAGQTVLHVHMHLIPRYSGDVPEPRGGVRGVIPSRQKY